ncbi:MAG TPA: protein kinase [Bryobacteraceae bacterium]|nr:protein kinase [Bryobacteraceae bacterium]
MDRIGRYKIVRELGRGAMGVVYHAIDPNIGRPVAIKTIQLGSGRQPEEQERLRERLFREARSAGILSHPGIVTIYDVEQQGDVAYIAMEYVDGPTLDQMLSRPQALSGTQMFSILGQTAVALDYAHQKGIVHRDIKPANIMVTGDGTAKITDFGIAKITASEQLTMTGSIVGTPHYMSPEQVQGLTVDGRSDQFSLAVIAFEMLTGEKPYTGEHLTTVVYKIVAEEPVAPQRLNPTLGGAMDAAVRKALSKKPDQRYRTCQEFMDALEQASKETRGWKTMPRGGSLNEPTVVDVAAPAAINLPPARPARHSDETTTAERSGRRKAGFLTFLLAMVVVVGLLVLIGTQAMPWLSTRHAPNADTDASQPAAEKQPSPTATVPPVATPAAPVANPTEPAATPPATPPAAAGASPGQAAPPPVEEKPSPMTPPEPVKPASQKLPEEEAPKPTPARRAPRQVVAAEPQPVTVITSPGGATAILDGRDETACTTPCNLNATPGHHSVTIELSGYGMERRYFDVGTGPMEISAIVLHAQGGTLMLTSAPSGALILVNGKRLQQTTPAQLQLAPGNYSIEVEKEGKQTTRSVEIRNGVISYLKITF